MLSGRDQTVITDFSHQDAVAITATTLAGGEVLSGLELFDALDFNGNASLGRGDVFTTTPAGTRLGVVVDAHR